MSDLDVGLRISSDTHLSFNLLVFVILFDTEENFCLVIYMRSTSEIYKFQGNKKVEED